MGVPLESRSLRYFLAVGEFGSYSRAAEFLRISQPAISRQISQLEEDLGQALFTRQSQGVRLTEAGKTLFLRGQNIIRQIEEARAEVKCGSQTISGNVTLAVPPAAGHFLVPSLVRYLGSIHPALSLRIIGGFSVLVHEWLVRGQVDLACTHDPLPQKGFLSEPLIDEPVFLVGHTDLLPRDKKFVRMQDLGDVPLILPSRPNASRRILDIWMARTGIALDIRGEVDDPTLIRALCRDGIGCSLLTQGNFQAETRLGELNALPFKPAVHWQLTLVQASTTKLSSAATVVAEAIRKIVFDLQTSGKWPGKIS